MPLFLFSLLKFSCYSLCMFRSIYILVFKLHLRVCFCQYKYLLFKLISIFKCHLNILNNIGERGHPWSTLLFVFISFVVRPWKFKVILVLWYKLFMDLINCFGYSRRSIIFHSLFLFSSSNAFTKSTKEICFSWLYSLHFSIICCNVNMASVVAAFPKTRLFFSYYF